VARQKNIIPNVQLIRGNYEKMGHQKRIDIIFYSVLHGMSLRQIAGIVDIPFSTVRKTIYDYETENRTNHLENMTSNAKLEWERAAY